MLADIERVIEQYSDMVYRIALTRTGTKENAEEVVNKFSNLHIYDSPYDDLYCGRLIIEKFEVDEKIAYITYSKMLGRANVIKE